MITEVIDAKPYHVGAILRRMRDEHAAAVTRLGVHAHPDLRGMFNVSIERKAWMVDGKLAALGGITGTLASSTAFVWLVIAQDATRFPIEIVKEAKRQMDRMMATRESLTTTIFAGDETSRRFAAFLGFRNMGDNRMEYRRAWPEVSAPFVVFGLPRSRTRWLSEFLGCSHDLPVSAGSLDELCAMIARGGSVETALARGWRVLRQRFPDIRFAVVRRPVDQSRASAARVGWTIDEAYLDGEDRRLDEIAALPGTVTVDFDDLETEDACSRIYEHCTGRPFDRRHWLALADRNIQVDMNERGRLLMANSDRMFALFAEIAATVTIQIEPFAVFLRDAMDLLVAHRAEAGEFEEQPVDPDFDMAQDLADKGQLILATARTGDEMIGYLVFIIGPIVETKGILVGFQNIFYVRPDHRTTLGPRLHAAARAELKRMGVTRLVLRSGVKAVAERQEILFKRLGARYMGSMFSLTLGN